jgi:hypothetical protein
MACGLPTIVTIGHSHLDYYNEHKMYGVKADIQIPARYDNWENQGHFVRCSVEDLAKVMKHVYENKEEAKKKGLSSVEYVKKYEYHKTMEGLAKHICQVSAQS